MPHIRRGYTNGRLILPVRLSHRDVNVVDAQQFRVDALLDTGTTMTVIHHDLAKDPALPTVGVTPLRGMTSLKWCFVHAVTLEIHISDLSEIVGTPSRSVYSWARTHIIGAPLPEKRDCLIGMDILDRLKLEVGHGECAITFPE